MGVNLKKVNRYLEFVTERHWRGLCSVSGLIALPYLYSGPMLSPLSPFINII